MFIGLDRAKRFGLCQRFSATYGIFDKGPYCEIYWKSFISPVSLILKQDCGCHNCLLKWIEVATKQSNESEGVRKNPKFEEDFT